MEGKTKFKNENVSNLSILNEEIKFRSFFKNFLKKSSEKQQKSILKLFILTKFFDILPHYINYINGLKRKEKLTEEEIGKIKEISRNKSINPFSTLFENINISADDLYLAMLIHSQRGFNRTNITSDIKFEDKLRTLAKNAISTSFINTVNPNDINTIAIFGATYTTMKIRALSGMKLFKNINNTKKKSCEIVLLTGFRDAYFSELKQLGITKINNRKFIELQNKINSERENKRGPIRAKDAVIYFQKHKKEEIDTYIDRIQLLNILNKLEIFGIKLPEELTNLSTIDILNIFAEQTTERELGLLAMSDICIDSSYPYKNKYKVNSIYTNDTNDTTGRRANTQDTIRNYINKGYKVNKTLFVSNDLFVQQQHLAVLDVLYNMKNKDDMNSVNTVGIPVRENIFYAMDSRNPNPALNSTASSLYTAFNRAINELSDVEYDINNLRTACNGENSKKININDEDYNISYNLGFEFSNSKNIYS